MPGLLHYLNLRSIASRRPLVLVALTAIAIVGFLAVARLSRRYSEQEKALARRMYAQGQNEQHDAHPERAIEDYRAALLYDRDNLQYQFSLAAALRDSGRTEESESYLIRLWEANPQDGMINRALGRLAAREGRVDKAIQYYHNAVYGVWTSDPGMNRLNTDFELIEFLLKSGAVPQAQAELILLSASNYPDPQTMLRIASLFARAQDYERALGEYEKVLQLDRAKVSEHVREREPAGAAERDSSYAAALAGAGDAAFHLKQYRRAEAYLREAVSVNPSDDGSRQLLQNTRSILDADPFDRGISTQEHNRRIQAAFDRSGERLDACAASQVSSSAASPDRLGDLKAQWLALKPKIARPNSVSERETANSAMDLVANIEEQTAKLCGPPIGIDESLLLLSEQRMSAEMGANP